jgi:hypothetical protein
MQTLIEKVLLFLEPVVKLVDKVFTIKASIKKINGDHYYLWRDKILPGAVFLTNTNGAGSNLINPSEINHGAIYFGKGLRSALVSLMSEFSLRSDAYGRDLYSRLSSALEKYDPEDEICYVIEAVGEGVKITNLVKFMTTKDKFKMYMPRFCDEFTRKQAAYNSLSDLMLPYDYAFSDRNSTRYCFEVCARAYNTAMKSEVVKMEKIKVLWGEFSAFTSDSFSKSKNWECVIDSDILLNN